MNKNVSLLAISYVFGFTAATITVFLGAIIGSQITSIKSLINFTCSFVSCWHCNLYYFSSKNNEQNRP